MYKRNKNKSKMFMIFCVLWFLNLSLNTTIEASYTNFDVKRYEVCNHTQGLIKYYGNMTKDNEKHYINTKLITPIPWDDNLGLSLSIQSKIPGNKFLELFVIREKNMCKALNMYLGEFWYDVARAIGLTPKVCPILPGTYQAHHIEINFKKITLQTLPFGRLRFIINAVDNKNPKSYILCLLLEVENIPD